MSQLSLNPLHLNNSSDRDLPINERNRKDVRNSSPPLTPLTPLTTGPPLTPTTPSSKEQAHASTDMKAAVLEPLPGDKKWRDQLQESQTPFMNISLWLQDPLNAEMIRISQNTPLTLLAAVPKNKAIFARLESIHQGRLGTFKDILFNITRVTTSLPS